MGDPSTIGESGWGGVLNSGRGVGGAAWLRLWLAGGRGGVGVKMMGRPGVFGRGVL